MMINVGPFMRNQDIFTDTSNNCKHTVYFFPRLFLQDRIS